MRADAREGNPRVGSNLNRRWRTIMAICCNITIQDAPAPSNIIQFPLARRRMQPTAAQRANAALIGDTATLGRFK